MGLGTYGTLSAMSARRPEAADAAEDALAAAASAEGGSAAHEVVVDVDADAGDPFPLPRRATSARRLEGLQVPTSLLRWHGL